MVMPILNLSHTPKWEWEKVYRHWVEGDPYQPESRTPEYYRLKYAVANFVKPKTICEIGVRAGYSAAAFLQAGHTERFLGIDLNEGTEGGVKGYIEAGRRTIAMYDGDNRIIEDNSQEMDRLPAGPYDLLHVDGDHSARGAYNDTVLGLVSDTKWILVDDFDFIPDVAIGAMQAVWEAKVVEMYYIYDYKYRGNLLIRNPRVE